MLMVIRGFLVVTLGRAKRRKENGAEKVLQAGVIFFWTYLPGQDNRIQYKPEEFILPVFEKTYCSLESYSGKGSTNKKRIYRRSGCHTTQFLFSFLLFPYPKALFMYFEHSVFPSLLGPGFILAECLVVRTMESSFLISSRRVTIWNLKL